MNTNYGSNTMLLEANLKYLLHSYDSLTSNEIHTLITNAEIIIGGFIHEKFKDIKKGNQKT